jgi:ribosomal protein S18 acetylase RimI-like enzyme
MFDQSYVDSLRLKKASLFDTGKVGDLVKELAGDASESQMRKRFRRLVIRPSYRVYFLTEEKKPISMWIGRIGYFLGADAPYLQMLGLVVHPDYQRKGLGTMLAAKYLSEIYGHSNFSQFWFITQHEHLYEFYESMGFERTGARFVYHGRGSGKPSLGRRITRVLGI